MHSSNSFHNLVSTTYQRCHICWVFVCDFYVCSDITFVIFNKSSNSIEKMAKILSLDIQLKFFRRKSSPSPRATKKKHEHVSNQQITACHHPNEKNVGMSNIFIIGTLQWHWQSDNCSSNPIDCIFLFSLQIHRHSPQMDLFNVLFIQFIYFFLANNFFSFLFLFSQFNAK